MGDADKLLCQRFMAPNDRNGNPRRVWLGYKLFHAGGVIVERAQKEGFEGRVDWCDSSVQLPSINVSPGEYRRLLKEHPYKKETA